MLVAGPPDGFDMSKLDASDLHDLTDMTSFKALETGYSRYRWTESSSIIGAV
jgi:hypothetical protein